MKQHLLFLSSHQPTAATLLSLDKNMATRLEQGISLDRIRGIDESDQLTVVLADQLVSNYELSLTARNQTQLMKAARYAIEEKIPGRLEDYHVVAQKGHKQRVSVRAIQHKRLQALLDILGTYKLVPNQVLVESDLLNHQVSTLILNDKEATLCGQNLDQTYEFDTALVPMIGQRIFSAIGNSQELQIIYQAEQNLLIEALQNQAPDNVRIKKILKDEHYYENLSRNQRSAINLLQGDFSIHGAEVSQKSLWHYPAWLTAMGVMIFAGGLLAQNLVLEHRISNQEKMLLQNYTKLFPGSREPRDIADLSTKITSKLNLRSTTSAGALTVGALDLLTSSVNASTGNPIQILGLTIDSNAAELLVMGDTVETLNTFKNKLQTEIGLEKTINMDSVSSKDEQYQGKISIR